MLTRPLKLAILALVVAVIVVVAMVFRQYHVTRMRAEDLIVSARTGDVAGLRRALDGGVDVNYRPKHPNWFEVGGYLPTALIEAAAAGHAEAVRFLLDHGADPRLEGGGDSPVGAAIDHHHTDIVKLLLDHGADPNAAIHTWGGTAIHRAARVGDVAALTLLLDHHGDPNVTTGSVEAETPLHLAASHGQVEAVRLLLSRGADPDRRDRDGRLPAHDAVLWKRAEVLAMLRTKQQKPDPFTTIELGDLEQLRQLLKSHPDWAKASPPPFAGAPLLHFVARKGRADMASLLLKAGADPNAAMATQSSPIPFCGTALYVASGEGHAGVVKVLLEAGASPDSGTAAVSPLNLVSNKGDVELVRLLLAHGATVDIHQDWHTPLADAAATGRIGAMKLLLAHGANPNATNAHGEGPLHQAVRFGRLDAARLLLAHGANKSPALLAILDDRARTKTPDDAALRALFEK